jgi:2-polyprenyl-3-methyl-5-hydroxy-6-metoxy-1,4-benzoquinol methylase
MIEYFDASAAVWAQHYRRSAHFQKRLWTTVDWISQNPQVKSILDYGCGSGVLVTELAKAGYSVTGVDVAPNMLIAASAMVRAAGLEARARFELVNAGRDGEFESRGYDEVVSLGVLEYLDDWQGCLLRLAKCVRNNGFLILSFPNRLSALRLAERFVYKYLVRLSEVAPIGRSIGRGKYLVHQQHRFGLKELVQVLDEQGLVLRRSIYHVAPVILRRAEGLERVGMSCIAEFVKDTHC